MRILPNKLTAAQRAKIKLAKVNQSTAKSAISEAGKTIRSVAANYGANKALSTTTAAETARRQNASNMNDALAIYNKIISGVPEGEGNSGVSGDKSTTEVGGSGSQLGG